MNINIVFSVYRRVWYRTFVFPHFDGKQLPAVGVDEEFPQKTQRVHKEGIFKLLPRVNTPTD